MKSKFKGWAWFLAGYAFLFTCILIACILWDIFLNNILPVYFNIIVTFFVAFTWVWIVLGELRNKVILVDIGYDNFVVKRYLGLGTAKTYYFGDMQGYKISFLYSASASYEYMYLIKDDKKIIKLSQFYHKNYDELKQAIIDAHVKDLGIEDYSTMREVKEIFVFGL